MNSKYPIAKIDRFTSQNLLPMFMNKGIFKDYYALPEREELLQAERDRLGIAELTFEQERELLGSVGKYRTSKYVVRDFGSYVIAFSSKLYIDLLTETEEDLKDELLKDNYREERIHDALRRIKLYKLGHRIAIIILAEAYIQREYTNLQIDKSRMLEYLGVSSEDKYIYRDLSDAVFSLINLDYLIYEYNTHGGVDPNAKTVGSFVYNVREDQKTFTFSVNPNFLGCVSSLVDHKKNDKAVFKSGYESYPTSLIPFTKNYSTPAYLLAHLLVMEKGNPQLNKRDKGKKVVAFKISNFMDKINIRHSRASRRKEMFLVALKEVSFVLSTEPDITTLQNTKPRNFDDIVLHITVDSDKRVLDKKLRSILLGAK